MRDALDDLVLGWHAALANCCGRALSVRIAAKLFIFRDDEEDRHHDFLRCLRSSVTDVLGWVDAHLRVALHFAGHLASLERYRLHLGARLLRKILKSARGGLRTARRSDSANLRYSALHSRVVSGCPRYKPAPVAAAPDAEAARIHARLTREKAECRADVQRLVGEIHLPAHRARLDRDLALLIGHGHFLNRHEPRVARSPSAIVEREHDIPALRKNGSDARLCAVFRASCACTQHEGGQLLVGLAVLWNVQVASHARAIAPYGHGALFDILGQLTTRGLGGAGGRTGGSAVRRARLRWVLFEVITQLVRRSDAILVGIDGIKEPRHFFPRDFPVAIAVEFFESLG